MLAVTHNVPTLPYISDTVQASITYRKMDENNKDSVRLCTLHGKNNMEICIKYKMNCHLSDNICKVKDIQQQNGHYYAHRNALVVTEALGAT